MTSLRAMSACLLSLVVDAYRLSLWPATCACVPSLTLPCRVTHEYAAAVQQDTAQQQLAGAKAVVWAVASHVRRHAGNPGAARARRGARAMAPVQRAFHCGGAAAHRGHDHWALWCRSSAGHVALDHRYVFLCVSTAFVTSGCPCVVGIIIGRSGAEMLQAVSPGLPGAVSSDPVTDCTCYP